MKLKFDADFIYPKLEAESFSDAVRKLSAKLIDRGYVEQSYPDKVIEREKGFPTGIQLFSMVVGIPHTEAQYVKKTMVSVATLTKPIKINNMINPKESLETKMLFMIAMADPKGQVEILQTLMGLFKKTSVLEKIASEDSSESICKLLKEAIS